MTIEHDTTEAGETLQEGHTMDGKTLHETATSGGTGWRQSGVLRLATRETARR